MDRIVEVITSNPDSFLQAVVLISVILAIAVTIIVCVALGVKAKRDHEASRREIAAYVAEGTMSVEDAENLLQPRPWWVRGEAARKVKETCRKVGGLS